jgi:hypothetical protein
VCRSLPPAIRFSASPWEKSSIHFERNSENSDVVVSISSSFFKADTQDLIAGGRVVPDIDTRSIKVGGNLPSRPGTDTDIYKINVPLLNI